MQAALACSQVHRNAPLHDLYTPGHAVPPVAQCLPTRCLYVLPFDSIIEGGLWIGGVLGLCLNPSLCCDHVGMLHLGMLIFHGCLEFRVSPKT